MGLGSIKKTIQTIYSGGHTMGRERLSFPHTFGRKYDVSSDLDGRAAKVFCLDGRQCGIVVF